MSKTHHEREEDAERARHIPLGAPVAPDKSQGATIEMDRRLNSKRTEYTVHKQLRTQKSAQVAISPRTSHRVSYDLQYFADFLPSDLSA